MVTGCTTHVRNDVGGGGRLQMEWNTSSYSYNLLERLTVSRNVQRRHFLIELFRQEVDIVVVSPEAGTIAPKPRRDADCNSVRISEREVPLQRIGPFFM